MRMEKKSFTKRELAEIAGCGAEKLNRIDRNLPADEKLFVASEENPKRFDLAFFVRRWAGYNAGTEFDAAARMAMTAKELATVAGYSYRQLHNIDMDLQEGGAEGLFRRSAADRDKYDLPFFVQKWVAYQTESAEEENLELSQIKAQHEKVKKDKTTLEVARMKGELVEVQALVEVWSNVAAAVRGRLVNLARKVAPALVMVENPETIEGIIDREIRDAMRLMVSTPLPGESLGEEKDGSDGEEAESE